MDLNMSNRFQAIVIIIPIEIQIVPSLVKGNWRLVSDSFWQDSKWVFGKKKKIERKKERNRYLAILCGKISFS